MGMSAVGASSAAQHVQAPRPAAAQAQAAQPVDGDGDHDGTRVAAGRLDIKV